MISIKKAVNTLAKLMAAGLPLLVPMLTPAWALEDSSQTAPTDDQLANTTYTGIYEEPVQLVDGRFEGPPFVEGAASRPTVVLLPKHTTFGDLDCCRRRT